MVDHRQLPLAGRPFAPAVDRHEGPVGEAHPRVVHRPDGEQRRGGARRRGEANLNVAALVRRQVHLHLDVLQVGDCVALCRLLR